MIDSEYLKNLFPRENEIPEEHRPLDPIHQRSYLVDGVLKNWEGPVQTVLSPVCVRRENGELEQVELGSYPAGRGSPERGGAGGRRRRLRQWPGRMADHVGRRADRLHAGIHQPDGGAEAPGRQPDHVGDRQEPGRFRKGVRPHRRLHPRHDRRAEGAGQQQLALRRWSRAPSARSAARRWAWCCAWGRTTIP